MIPAPNHMWNGSNNGDTGCEQQMLCRFETVSHKGQAGENQPVLYAWHRDALISRPVAGLPDGLRCGDWILLCRDHPGVFRIKKVSECRDSAQPDRIRWIHPYPGGSLSRMQLLRFRREIKKLWESVFESRGYLSVDMPVLLQSVNPEQQLGIFKAGPGYLSTSPELQMKRMLCGGFDRILSIGPCFRSGEIDRFHNPEFTMAEWYRAGGSLQDLVQDLQKFFHDAAGIWPGLDNSHMLHFRGKTIDLSPPWEESTVADILQTHLGFTVNGMTTAPELYEAGCAAGLFEESMHGESFEQLFSRLWERIESRLGEKRALLVTEWPAPLASLAALKPGNPSVALRMELIVGGLELANGFCELSDPHQNRIRFEHSLEERRIQGMDLPEMDHRFLEAMHSGLPPAAGMAAGFDRICQVLTGADAISQVLPFSWDEL